MLKGKVALVTGSTSGIGLGIAKVLARNGADIMINGLGDPQQIEQAKKELAGFGGRVEYDGADLSKSDQATSLVSNTISKLGQVDIMVNNAGIQHVSPIENFTGAKWEQVISINLSSAFYTISAALPDMRKRGWGRVVNIASAHGLVASANKSAYVASKHGLLGLSKVVALEAAKDKNITSNCICPGWVLTPLVENQIKERAAKSGRTYQEEEEELLSEKQPKIRFTLPEEVGELALYLCSEAASNVTGTQISIDGGWTAV
jgi:3-hydroxybutyrate dehydrogenase